MNELALFSGAGGGILGGTLLGWRTVCAVEINAYCARRLMQRQNEGHLPPFPIWDDVRTFDGHAWRGIARVVSAGFPCQDVSVAGTGDGLDGERSGLWSECRRVLGEVEPEFALLENSPALTTRGLGTVLGDLAALGFDAEWGVLGAHSAGLDHRRERIWIVAHSISNGLQGWNSDEAQRQRGEPRRPMAPLRQTEIRAHIPAPDAFGNPVGMAGRMERLRAIGNGQVPGVAALAWRTLSE